MIPFFVRPVYLLMNRLNILCKFLLIGALFGLPLAYFGVTLGLELLEDTNTTKAQKLAVRELRSLTELVEAAEDWRDIRVPAILSRESSLQNAVDAAQAELSTRLSRVEEVITSMAVPSRTQANRYLVRMREQLESDTLLSRSEAARPGFVFENVHTIVADAHQLRKNQSGSFTAIADSELLGIWRNIILNIVPESMHALGKAHALGTFYLTQSYIDDAGAGALEAAYRELDREVREAGYQNLLLMDQRVAGSGIATHSNLPDLLVQARDLLDQEVIQAMELDYGWSLFHKAMQSIRARVYEEQYAVMDNMDELLAKQLVQREQHLYQFLSVSALICALGTYLYIGLYVSMRHNIRQLSLAASKVAEGDLESPIRLEAFDELRTLSKSMNRMREQIREREQALKHLSVTDALTQIPNRGYFEEVLRREWARAERQKTSLAIVLLDADHFKQINDTYGHLAGDVCLKHLARLLKGALRRPVDVCARWGGEEFIALLPDTSLQGALEWSEQLRAAIAGETVQAEGMQIGLSASLGVSVTIPRAGRRSDALIAAADAALYEAKQLGRNCSQARELL